MARTGGQKGASRGEASSATGANELPSLAEMQHWTGVLGQAQQMMLEHVSGAMAKVPGDFKMPDFALPDFGLPDFGLAEWKPPAFIDPEKIADQQSEMFKAGLGMFGQLMQGDTGMAAAADLDRRFNSDEWRATPVFDVIRQSYLLLCDAWLKSLDAIEGLTPAQRSQINFAARTMIDALSPANFPLTNPRVLQRIFETRGGNLLRGLEHMLADIAKGQLSHTRSDAFEVGRNVAATPGKVIHETPLYQLIQYTPTTEKVLATPLLIFPPWINRFYILDLNQRNSFIKWAVDQGLTVFVVSWKSADESMIDTTMDDYVVRGQIEAIDIVRDQLGVESVHVVGYCVAGTALAMGLAYLAAKGEAGKVATATFFTTQVDFSDAGELKIFVTDDQLAIVDALTAGKGYLDGRYMAMTFNLLRSRELIWSYVVQNYLLGEDYPEFDLLFWNSDFTNLPAKWHRAYLEQLYRDNLMVVPGGTSIDGVPIDLRAIRTPAYIQAGREDHIAPLLSVWKITEHLSGPMRFVLAGSGHIAGVVNPPAANKYQYWTNAAKVETLDAFIAGAVETAGSWWPDWRAWIGEQAPAEVLVKGARVPGRGKRKAIEDAPGRYVRQR